jgi:hypothetical protein
VTLSGEFGGGGCGVVAGCEPGPGPSGGAFEVRTGVAEIVEAADVVGCAIGSGAEHAVSSAKAAAETRILPTAAA